MIAPTVWNRGIIACDAAYCCSNLLSRDNLPFAPKALIDSVKFQIDPEQLLHLCRSLYTASKEVYVLVCLMSKKGFPVEESCIDALRTVRSICALDAMR